MYGTPWLMDGAARASEATSDATGVGWLDSEDSAGADPPPPFEVVVVDEDG